MLKTGIDFSLLLKLQAISWLPEPVAGSAGCLGNSASLKRGNHCVYWPCSTATATALKRRRQAAGFYMFHSQLTQFYVTQLQDMPCPSLFLPVVVQCSSPTAYQIRWRQEGRCHLLFLRVERTTRTVGCSTFHTQWGHLQDMLLLLLLLYLLLPVVFVVLWLIIIICAFYISVFYCSTFLIHSHTHPHTETQWHTRWETVHFHWLHIGYNKSHTQRQQLHLLPLTVVECVSLAHTPFPLCCVRHPWFMYICHILPSNFFPPSLP